MNFWGIFSTNKMKTQKAEPLCCVWRVVACTWGRNYSGEIPSWEKRREMGRIYKDLPEVKSGGGTMMGTINNDTKKQRVWVSVLEQREKIKIGFWLGESKVVLRCVRGWEESRNKFVCCLTLVLAKWPKTYVMVNNKLLKKY